MDSIIQAISTVGFPIVCCIALFWYQSRYMQNFTKEIQVSLKELSDTLNSNTNAITKLCTTVSLYMGGDKDGQD